MRVVVLGGYGNFGARICRALIAHSNIELIVAGRSQLKTNDFVATLSAPATAAVIDIERDDFTQQLRLLNAQLVIHTAGPFQQQDYRVPLAVAAAGAHYIDLADGRRFVCDFVSAVNSAFVQAGKCAITGASTVPALSSAVVNALTQHWQSVESIDICIGPAQTAPRGLATMAAVLSYCGAPICVWNQSEWQTQFGWSSPSPVKFARMKPRLGALCDIPDLELFPKHYAGVRSVMFRAALELSISQRVFAALATFRQWGWLSHPEKFASVLLHSAKWFDYFGSSLGGMYVKVTGRGTDGSAISRSWHIAADHDHGPEIPCMAAILLAQKLASEQLTMSGAYTAMHMLELSEFSAEFSKWGMQTDIIEHGHGEHS